MSEILNLYQKIRELQHQKAQDLEQLEKEYYVREPYLKHLGFMKTISFKVDNYGTVIIRSISNCLKVSVSNRIKKTLIYDIPIQDWNEIMKTARQILFQDDARIEKELKKKLDYLSNTTTLLDSS